jgi:hypothetical protein
LCGKLAINLAACKASASSFISFFDIPASRNEVLGGAREGAREGVRLRDGETGTLFLKTTLPGVGLALLLGALGALDALDALGGALDGGGGGGGRAVVIELCLIFGVGAGVFGRLEPPPRREHRLEYFLLRVCRRLVYFFIILLPLSCPLLNTNTYILFIFNNLVLT